MEIKNERLIVNEDEIDEATEKIHQIIQDKLDELGHGNVIAQVEFFDDFNEDCTLFWNEIDICLVTTDGLLADIEYRTEGLQPTLVLVDDEFEFFYVFDLSSYTSTSLKYMENIGLCDFDEDNDELLENILLEELAYNLEN